MSANDSKQTLRQRNMKKCPARFVQGGDAVKS
jgi:hypothetical protein